MAWGKLAQGQHLNPQGIRVTVIVQSNRIRFLLIVSHTAMADCQLHLHGPSGRMHTHGPRYECALGCQPVCTCSPELRCTVRFFQCCEGSYSRTLILFCLSFVFFL